MMYESMEYDVWPGDDRGEEISHKETSGNANVNCPSNILTQNGDFRMAIIYSSRLNSNPK